MFELVVLMCQDKSYINKETNQKVNRFKVWVSLPDGSGAWVRSDHSIPVGSKVKLVLFSSPYNDTDGMLMVKIA